MSTIQEIKESIIRVRNNLQKETNELLAGIPGQQPKVTKLTNELSDLQIQLFRTEGDSRPDARIETISTSTIPTTKTNSSFFKSSNWLPIIVVSGIGIGLYKLATKKKRR